LVYEFRSESLDRGQVTIDNGTLLVRQWNLLKEAQDVLLCLEELDER
jgi:hypothetical protein